MKIKLFLFGFPFLIILIYVGLKVYFDKQLNYYKHKYQEEVVAVVNKSPIYFNTFKLRLLEFSSKNNEKIKKLLLNRLIVEKLLYLYGTQHHIVVSKTELQNFLNDILSDYQNYSDFELQLLNNYDTFENYISALKYILFLKKSAAHIVAPYLKTISKDQAISYYSLYSPHKTGLIKIQHFFNYTKEPLDKVEKIIKTQSLIPGKEIEQLVYMYSISPESKQGGYLLIDKLSYYPKVFEIVQTLSENTCSDVLKSEYGYHIICLINKHITISQDKLLDIAFNYIMVEKERSVYKAWLRD